jgi:hypothetical protein
MHGGGSVDFFWRPLACAVIHAASTTPHQGEWHSKRRTSAPRRCWGTRRRVAMGATSRQYAASRKAVAQMANGIFFLYWHFPIAYCVLQPRPLLPAIPPVPRRPIEPRLVVQQRPRAMRFPHTRRRARSHCLWMHFACLDSAVRIAPARFVSPHHHRRHAVAIN